MSASATPATPLLTAVSLVSSSTRASSADGSMNRLYRSCDSDVVSMKSTASAALISAEKTAARPSAPTAGGSAAHQDRRQRELGCFAATGNSIRAAMPRITGTAA